MAIMPGDNSIHFVPHKLHCISLELHKTVDIADGYCHGTDIVRIERKQRVREREKVAICVRVFTRHSDLARIYIFKFIF